MPDFTRTVSVPLWLTFSSALIAYLIGSNLRAQLASVIAFPGWFVSAALITCRAGFGLYLLTVLLLGVHRPALAVTLFLMVFPAVTGGLAFSLPGAGH